MTVAQLRDIEKQNPQMPQYGHRVTCGSYQQFLDTLYGEIGVIVRSLVNDANVMQMHSENALNADICRQLCRLGYDAHHDKNNRGHTDILVEYGVYSWLGEGKKVTSANNTHLEDGYDQLVHRYVPGTPNADQAGLLIYSFAPDAKHVLNSWCDHLIAKDAANPGYADDIRYDIAGKGFEFWSASAHVSSGMKLTIKHLVVSLHWAPPKSKPAPARSRRPSKGRASSP